MRREVFRNGLQPVSDDLIDPEAFVVKADEFFVLENALGKLNPEPRRVIVLRFWRSRSYTDIGQIMGKSDDAVRRMEFRALRRLRRLVAEKI